MARMPNFVGVDVASWKRRNLGALGLLGALLVAMSFVFLTGSRTADNPTTSFLALQEQNPTVTVLFCVARYRYEAMSDRWFFELYKAAKDNPFMDAYMWGPQWEGWRNGTSAKENIRQFLAGKKHVLIMLSKDHCEPWTLHSIADSFESLALSYYTHESMPMEGGGLDMEWVGDAFGGINGLKGKPGPYHSTFIKNNHLDLVFFSYACEMGFYSHLASDRLFVHLPHTAPRAVFEGHTPHTERQIPVLLTGARTGYYPFRVTLAKMIQDDKIPGLVRAHPGYPEMKSSVVSKLHELGISSNKAEDQQTDYANQMKNSQIVLCTRSIRQYSLRKYIEAAMSGALVVGNIPLSDRPDEFRQWVVEIDEAWSEDKIANTINYWLNNPELRAAKAAQAQAFVLSHYTCDNAMQLIYTSWKDYVVFKRRGMIFPYSTSTCDYARPFGPKQSKER